jgi:hypothetical protein
MRLPAIVSASLAAVMVMAAPAPAGTPYPHAVVLPDQDDARGRLDMRELKDGKREAGSLLKIRVLFYEGWRPRVLKPEERSSFGVLFNTDRDAQAEYRGSILLLDGDLVARIRGQGETLIRAVARPNPATARFSVPGDSGPNPEGGEIELRTRTVFLGRGCSPGCPDRIPFMGWAPRV